MTDFGPLEVLMVEFPGNQFNGEIAPALAELVRDRLIRVIDLLFVTKDADGDIAAIELADVDDDVEQALRPHVDDLSGLISEEDIEDLGEALDPDSSAAILLFEHLWAIRLRDALAGSGAEVIASVRIPQDAVDEVLAVREAG